MIVVPAAAAPASNVRRVQGVFIAVSSMGFAIAQPILRPSNSLRTGKITGNFLHVRSFRRFLSARGIHLGCNSGTLQSIPCSAPNREIVSRKQGIHLSETRNYRTRYPNLFPPSNCPLEFPG